MRSSDVLSPEVRKAEIVAELDTLTKLSNYLNELSQEAVMAASYSKRANRANEYINYTMEISKYLSNRQMELLFELQS